MVSEMTKATDNVVMDTQLRKLRQAGSSLGESQRRGAERHYASITGTARYGTGTPRVQCTRTACLQRPVKDKRAAVKLNTGWDACVLSVVE